MSQAGEINVAAGILPPAVPTSFVENSGTAIPVANILNVLGGNNISTSGAGNTVTVGVSGLTNNAMLIGNSLGGITSVGPATNGQVLIGSTGLAPVLATLTAGANITITNQPGGIVIASTGGGGGGTGVQTLTGNVGAANAVLNNINVIGSGAVSTSGSGNTLTISFNPTITGDSGGALSLTAGNWNILGQQAGTIPVMDTVGSVSTLKIENRTFISSLVVDPSSTVGLRGTFTTISLALAAAVSGQTIYVRPGTYTENLTLVSGVNIVAMTADAFTPNVKIIGKCTMNVSGTVTLSGLQLQTNSDFAIAVTGSVTSVLNLVNCYLNCSNNTGISFSSSSASSNISLSYCYGQIQTTGIAYFASTSAGLIDFEYCFLDNIGNSVTANTISSGVFNGHYSKINNPITVSGTADCVMRHCRMLMPNATAITTSSSGSTKLTQCYFEGGTASALSMSTTINLQSCTVQSSNTNAITGAGTLVYTPVSFVGTSTGVNTTTQTTKPFGPRILLNGGCELLSGSGSPSGSVTSSQGSLYLRTDGSSSTTRAYINTDGGTTWTAITTVA